MKKEDRASLSVSKQTRERFLNLMFELQAVKKRRMNQDDVLSLLLDHCEKVNAKRVI